MPWPDFSRRLGFVERDERSHDYRLGMGVLRLGFEYLASLELTELGQPILRRLVDTFRQAANLVASDGRHVVYVAKLTLPSLLNSSITVGCRRMPPCRDVYCLRI